MARELKLQINIDIKDVSLLIKELPNASLVSRAEITEYPDIPGVKSYIYTFKDRVQANLFVNKIKIFLESKGLKGLVSLHSCLHSENKNECVVDYIYYGTRI